MKVRFPVVESGMLSAYAFGRGNNLRIRWRIITARRKFGCVPNLLVAHQPLLVQLDWWG